MRVRIATLAWLSAALIALCACGDDGGGTPAMQAQGVQSLSCMPMTPRTCPCLYGGMGTQMCLPSGAGYGACQGCLPRPKAQPVAPTMTPTVDPMPVDSGMPMMPADAAMDMMDMTDGSMGDGSMPMTDGPMVMAGMEGTSCGVGLPTLCALETEKCCVRSLATDTCIEAQASCDCSVRGCETLEAFCDGPEDCADGQVCCGTLGGSTYSEFRCADSCDYRGTQRIACHQGETECPSGDVCANSQLLTNLQVCIDPSSIQQ